MIEKIRKILSSACLSNDPHKCIKNGECDKCENEALEKLIAEHDAKVRRQAIEEVIDDIKNVFPECSDVTDFLEQLKGETECQKK